EEMRLGAVVVPEPGKGFAIFTIEPPRAAELMLRRPRNAEHADALGVLGDVAGTSQRGDDRVAAANARLAILAVASAGDHDGQHEHAFLRGGYGRVRLAGRHLPAEQGEIRGDVFVAWSRTGDGERILPEAGGEFLVADRNGRVAAGDDGAVTGEF